MQKIQGEADLALCAYSVSNDDWPKSKRDLALHYADKRDRVPTLEYQLSPLTQGSKSIEEFYIQVNSHFSLGLNKLKEGDRDSDLAMALIETCRDKALDVLNGDASKLLLIRGPYQSGYHARQENGFVGNRRPNN